MMDSSHGYVHGYSDREGLRLADQATTLADLLHRDTRYAAGSRVLEVGCGVGAQTAILLSQNPGARIVSMDIAFDSLHAARARVAGGAGDPRRFVNADIFRLPFVDGAFDHAFVCFVLEHLTDPVGALAHVRRVLKLGGSLTVIEGDHGSAYFHPASDAAWRTIACLIEAQARGGGDALIGRRLYPMLRAAGFCDVAVSPRVVYADGGRPEWVEGFTRRTFIAMVEGARQRVLGLGLIDAASWDAGIVALRRTADQDGTFNYTFFKGTARR